jgi:hypothetical protein
LNEKDRKKAKKLKAIESDDEDEDEGKIFHENSGLKLKANFMCLICIELNKIVLFLSQRTRKESGKSCRTSLTTIQ